MNNIPRYLLARLGLLIISIVLITSSANSQQAQVYNQFFMNPYIYNPAYAGVDGHSVVFAMYKQQWSKISGGPQLSHATFHTPLKGGIGLGAAVFNYVQGPLTSNVGKVSSSYLVSIDRKHFIRFGMSLGGGTNQLTIPEDGLGDPAFVGNAGSYLIGDFGATYHFDHFNVGFSLPNLFSSPVLSESGGFVNPEIRPTDQMLFKMNYRGHINGSIAVEPHFLYRYSSVVPSQWEITSIVHVKHVAWVGGTYRQDAGAVALLGVKLQKKFAVGAAFELGNADYNSLTGSSFEIHVGMHFGTHHKGGHHVKDHHRDNHHRTIFVTESEKHIRQDSIRRAERLAKKFGDTSDPLVVTTPTDNTVTESEETIDWDMDNQVISNVTPGGDVQTGQKMERNLPDGTKEVIVAFTPPRDGGSAWAIAPGAHQYEERTGTGGQKEVGVKWVRLGQDGSLETKIVWEPVLDEAGAAAVIAGSGSDRETTDTSDNQTDEVEAGQETNTGDTETNTGDQTGSVTTPVDTGDQETQPSDKELADSQEHHEVTHGGSMVEFPPGIYVVSRSFSSYGQAETYSDRLFSQGYRDVRVGKISGRDNWYVMVKKYSSLGSARQDKDRLKAKISGIWVLKVN